MNIETGKIISSDCLKDLLVSNPKEAKKVISTTKFNATL